MQSLTEQSILFGIWIFVLIPLALAFLAEALAFLAEAFVWIAANKAYKSISMLVYAVKRKVQRVISSK